MPSTVIDPEAPTRPHLPIDPRIRQRLLDVRREESHRRLRILIGVTTAIAAVAGAIGILHTPLWKVRHVRIEGTSPALPASLVRRTAGLDGEVLMVDVGAEAEVGRLEGLPLVATATVRREWPGTVRIGLTTRTAVAVLDAGGVRVEVDRTGRVLAAGGSVGPGLPSLQVRPGPVAVGAWLPSGAGPGGAALQATDPSLHPSPTVSPTRPLPAELALAAVLGPAIRAQVASIGVTGQGLVASVGTIAVVFGDSTDLGAKATALAAVLAAGPLTGVRVIDLTVPDRPALTGGSAAAASTAGPG